jgi:hypothetical protein
MRRRLAGALASLLVLASIPASAQTAQEPTAADFAEICESDAAATREACGNLLAGLLEVYVVIGTKNDARRVACPPRMMTPDEMRNVFVAWAVTRNDLARMSAPEAAAIVVKERFPCSQIVIPRRK